MNACVLHSSQEVSHPANVASFTPSGAPAQVQAQPQTQTASPGYEGLEPSGAQAQVQAQTQAASPGYEGIDACADTFLPKTIRSGGRFWYAAGLEHTGHTLWHDGIMPELVKNGSLRMVYDDDTSMHRPSCTKRHHNDSLKHFLHHWTTAPKKDGAIIPTAFVSCSYPCLGDEYCCYTNPDIRWLAGVAEYMSSDFRVIYLTRQVEFILHGAGFVKSESQRHKELLHACLVMLGQMQMMDQDFFVCSPYDQYGKNDKILTEFLSVDISSAIKRSLKPSKQSLPKVPLVSKGTRSALGELRACVAKADAYARC